MYICIYLFVYSFNCMLTPPVQDPPYPCPMDVPHSLQCTLLIHTNIWSPPPPPPHHDRPSPSKHRSHRRVRAFSRVSSLSFPIVSVEPPEDRDQKPQTQRFTKIVGTVFFVVCYFVSFVLYCWSCRAGRFVSQSPKSKILKHKKQNILQTTLGALHERVEVSTNCQIP